MYSMYLGVVVRTKTKRVDRHISDINSRGIINVLVTIGQEEDASDTAAGDAAAGEDSEASFEAGSYVGRVHVSQAVDDVLQLCLVSRGHGEQRAQPLGVVGEHDDGEAVDWPELLDDEVHGGLHLVEPTVLLHAPADV